VSAVYKRGNAEIEANFTSMIDVTFLLIIFFVLVSKIVSAESVELDLPRPFDPHTEAPTEEHRVIVNVVKSAAEPGAADGYRIGSLFFPADGDGLIALADHLASLFAADPRTNVNLRADRMTGYEFVHPAMQAITLGAAQSGVEDLMARVNLVVEPIKD